MGLIFGLMWCVVLAASAYARPAPASKPTTTAAAPTTRPRHPHRHAAKDTSRDNQETRTTKDKTHHGQTAGRTSLWDTMRSTPWWTAMQHWIAECGEDHWAEAEAFMKANSPRRWKAYESLKPNSESQRNVRRYILTRYNSLAPLQEHDPALYKMQLQELKLEDEIFGVATGLRGRRTGAEIRQRLEKLAGDLVDTQLKVREMRIARLEKAVASAKKRLKKDQGRRDQLVKNEIRRVEKHAEPPHHHRSDSRHHSSATTRPATTRPAK